MWYHLKLFVLAAPVWRHLKLFVLAFALATFAFWTTMLNDPPLTEASSPVDLPTPHSTGFSPFLEEGLVSEMPQPRHYKSVETGPAYLRELRAGVD